MARRLQTMGRLMALCLCLLPGKTPAMEDLYSAQVSVPDQSQEARKEAFRKALSAVLIKVVGRTGISPPESEPFVEQYAYHESPEGWQLWVRFQPDALNRWLQEQGLPVWGKTRPPVILWLALEEGGRRRLLGEGDDKWGPLLLQEAKRRGLPLILPLLDLEDLSKVKVGWVWGDFLEPLREASRRYGAEVMLVGRVFQEDGGWLGRWTLYLNGDTEHWQSRGGLESVLRSAIDGAADRLARRLAVIPRGTLTSIAIRVTDIVSLDGYVDTQRYLEALPLVEAVKPKEVRPETVLFHVRLKGTIEEIEQAIAVQGRLIPLAMGDDVLEYRRHP